MGAGPDVERVAAALHSPGLRYRNFVNQAVRRDPTPPEVGAAAAEAAEAAPTVPAGGDAAEGPDRPPASTAPEAAEAPDRYPYPQPAHHAPHGWMPQGPVPPVSFYAAPPFFAPPFAAPAFAAAPYAAPGFGPPPYAAPAWGAAPPAYAPPGHAPPQAAWAWGGMPAPVAERHAVHPAGPHSPYAIIAAMDRALGAAVPGMVAGPAGGTLDHLRQGLSHPHAAPWPGRG